MAAVNPGQDVSGRGLRLYWWYGGRGLAVGAAADPFPFKWVGQSRLKWPGMPQR